MQIIKSQTLGWLMEIIVFIHPSNNKKVVLYYLFDRKTKQMYVYC